MARFDNDIPFANDASELIAQLRQRSWQQLLEMPPHPQKDVVRDGRGAALSIWRDLLPEKGVQIVVQIYLPGRLGTARLAADGFVMAMSGVITELAGEDLYDFT